MLLSGFSLILQYCNIHKQTGTLLYIGVYIYVSYTYIHVYIWYIYVNEKWSPRTEGKKQNLFCIPTLKPKGLFWSSIMALCWISRKKKCFLKSASFVSLLFQYLNGADDVNKTLLLHFWPILKQKPLNLSSC